MKLTIPRDMLMRILMTAIAALMLCLCLAAPSNARFLQPDNWDPWLDGVDINRYAYGNNDPVNQSDPNGHQHDDVDGDGDPDFMDQYPGIPDRLIKSMEPGGPMMIGRPGAVGGQGLANNLKSMGSKKIPNPGGKLGDATTRAKTDALVRQIESRGNKAKIEERIVIGNGFKPVRYVDIVERDPSGKIVAYHQIGKINKNGLPVIRERKAISDIEGATGSKVQFHKKPDPPKQGSSGGSSGGSGGTKTGSGSKGGFIDTLKSLFGF
jgi:hypothetical protein